jgi:hypothetical protein
MHSSWNQSSAQSRGSFHIWSAFLVTSTCLRTFSSRLICTTITALTSTSRTKTEALWTWVQTWPPREPWKFCRPSISSWTR